MTKHFNQTYIVCDIYQTGGIEQLLRFQAGGSQARLSASEQQQLKAHLDDNLCLSTQVVIAYVEEPWNIHYSEQGMNHLLHRLGYVYKKPCARQSKYPGSKGLFS